MNFDFAIVGAGIAGATLAARLADGARVLLLEREEQPGYHSTGRSAAMFMESYGAPQARALTRASRASYEALGVLGARGALYVAWRGQEQLLEQTLQSLRDTGAAVERLDAAATLQRVPALRAEGLIGAISEPEATDLDVHALHQQALRSARQHGCELWLRADVQRAEALHDGAGRGWQVQCADGRSARCTVLVNAAGAWADTLAESAGLPGLGLQPCRRSALSFEAPGHEHRHWPTVAAIDESWYFKPDAGQLLGSPANADPVPPHDVQAEELDIATAIERIEAHTTLRIRRPRRVWAGLRTFASDGELVIGFDPRSDLARAGFFWLAAQGGYGIQSAAGAAMLAESLLRGRPLPAALRGAAVQAQAMDPARLLPR